MPFRACASDISPPMRSWRKPSGTSCLRGASTPLRWPPRKPSSRIPRTSRHKPAPRTPNAARISPPPCRPCRESRFTPPPPTTFCSAGPARPAICSASSSNASASPSATAPTTTGSKTAHGSVPPSAFPKTTAALPKPSPQSGKRRTGFPPPHFLPPCFTQTQQRVWKYNPGCARTQHRLRVFPLPRSPKPPASPESSNKDSINIKVLGRGGMGAWGKEGESPEGFLLPSPGIPPPSRYTPALMLQGTSSNAGKSILAAAYCRIFRQDGYSVAPSKRRTCR